MRKFSVINRSKVDSLVKDFVASILSSRKVCYLDDHIRFHKNIGYDFEACSGKHISILGSWRTLSYWYGVIVVKGNFKGWYWSNTSLGSNINSSSFQIIWLLHKLKWCFSLLILILINEIFQISKNLVNLRNWIYYILGYWFLVWRDSFRFILA